MEDNMNAMDLIDPDQNHYNDFKVNFSAHSIENFTRNANLNTNSLNILHHNSRSIMRDGRLSEYDLFFKSIENPFKILIFTETWLTESKMDTCKFQGYSPVHLLRPADQHIDFKEKGGGISIFVHNTIQFKHRDDLDVILPYMECCLIVINYNKKKILNCRHVSHTKHRYKPIFRKI